MVIMFKIHSSCYGNFYVTYSNIPVTIQIEHILFGLMINDELNYMQEKNYIQKDIIIQYHKLRGHYNQVLNMKYHE